MSTGTLILILLAVVLGSAAAIGLCSIAKQGDDIIADFEKLDDFTRWEAEVRP